MERILSTPTIAKDSDDDLDTAPLLQSISSCSNEGTVVGRGDDYQLPVAEAPQKNEKKKIKAIKHSSIFPLSQYIRPEKPRMAMRRCRWQLPPPPSSRLSSPLSFSPEKELPSTVR